MKKFKMKPETKAKLKNAWIEASPFVAPLIVGVGGLLYLYSKGSDRIAHNYMMSSAIRDAAYVSMSERVAASTEQINEQFASQIDPSE